MKLTVQKRLAASVLGCSPKRVHFAPDRINDIKEAITKADIKSLVNDGTITKVPAKGVSRSRANKRLEQRRKGLQRGPGKRKGKKTAIVPRKSSWIARIRVQRDFLKELREKDIIDPAVFKDLYGKSKGGFFRSKRHIKIYIAENELARKE
ncbi:MAG: 50S ribosomal protein L19e [Candidatus Woesearchaeota archaeon]